MKKYGINGWAILEIGVFPGKFGGDINAQHIKSLFQEKKKLKEKIDGLQQEIKKKQWRRLLKVLKEPI